MRKARADPRMTAIHGALVLLDPFFLVVLVGDGSVVVIVATTGGIVVPGIVDPGIVVPGKVAVDNTST
jgi:hypothetical protein